MTSEKIDVVAGVIERDGLILLQFRVNTDRHADHWGLPGGRVEPGEPPEVAIARELNEEIGIDYAPGSDSTYRCNASVGLMFQAFVVSAWQGEVHNVEPHRCRELRWCAIDALPGPITPGTETILRLHAEATGRRFRY